VKGVYACRGHMIGAEQGWRYTCSAKVFEEVDGFSSWFLSNGEEIKINFRITFNSQPWLPFGSEVVQIFVNAGKLTILCCCSLRPCISKKKGGGYM
jgi:hypothetical protein